MMESEIIKPPRGILEIPRRFFKEDPMSDLFRKYADLKKKVGGNRELMGYEETFGMPREEQQHITPPARYLVRILAEC